MISESEFLNPKNNTTTKARSNNNGDNEGDLVLNQHHVYLFSNWAQGVGLGTGGVLKSKFRKSFLVNSDLGRFWRFLGPAVVPQSRASPEASPNNNLQNNALPEASPKSRGWRIACNDPS